MDTQVLLRSIYLYLFIIYILCMNYFPQLWGRHASCHEMRESRSVKLKDMKEEIFSFILLSCGLGQKRVSALPGLIRLWHLTTIASRQGQGFISRATPHAFPLKKTSPYTPIMHHFPYLPDIQTSLLQAVLHYINPPLPRPTH